MERLLTKKLPEWEKQQNKMRRALLSELRRLAKDKTAILDYQVGHEWGRRMDGTPYHTGINHLKVKWHSKLPRKRVNK